MEETKEEPLGAAAAAFAALKEICNMAFLQLLLVFCCVRDITGEFPARLRESDSARAGVNRDRTVLVGLTR